MTRQNFSCPDHKREKKESIAALLCQSWKVKHIQFLFKMPVILKSHSNKTTCAICFINRRMHLAPFLNRPFSTVAQCSFVFHTHGQGCGEFDWNCMQCCNSQTGLLGLNIDQTRLTELHDRRHKKRVKSRRGEALRRAILSVRRG